MIALRSFAPTPPDMTLTADARLLADGALALHYALRSDSVPLIIPEAAPSASPVNGLWQHTCFEVFVQGEDAPGYAEFNFTPSSQWAAYRFAAYREGGVALAMTDPGVDCRVDHPRLTLDVTLAAAVLPPGSRLRIGLTAVLEADDGNLSYWALTHTGERPDFHRADAFILELTR